MKWTRYFTKKDNASNINYVFQRINQLRNFEAKPQTQHISSMLQRELRRDNVKILDPNLVFAKLKRIQEEGNKALQMVTDFDLTLTKPTVNGNPAVGSLEMFKIMEGTGPDLIRCGQETMRNFYKLIQEPNLSSAHKIHMTDRVFIKFNKCLKSLPFTSDSAFEREAAKGIFVLRKGTFQLFNLLKENLVPVLVLSGGLTCIINYVLTEQNLMSPNVHVMANSFKYNSSHIESFNGKIIHFFNKNIHYLESDLYKKELFKRPNIILLGDSVSDALMVHGVPYHFNVLKIGFYHPNLWEDELDKFQKNFDIVITQDETMDIINSLLADVLPS